MSNNKLEPTTSFLGRGWSFPPEFDRIAGELRMTEEEQDIEGSLTILLGTTAGERLLHPKYGLNLQQYLFESLNTSMQTLLKDKVKTNLLVYEPRIEVERLELDQSRLLEGVLAFDIDYRVRTTNSRFNLVYPFYLYDGSEVGNNAGAVGQ
ncbi:GPW/gp25 family protein [Halioxenophilus sp. WMMB6]|uniref:GPW/gp25 family protein n=1 Tax=Halioxenophilus sp. WMMB6 TaxID=3073815 RepID=UPI00295E7945|nr:GPW/gp25 family protein [Halioxenophilus sp. WMMB6]